MLPDDVESLPAFLVNSRRRAKRTEEASGEPKIPFFLARFSQYHHSELNPCSHYFRASTVPVFNCDSQLDS